MRSSAASTAGRTPGAGPKGLMLALRSSSSRQSQPLSLAMLKRSPPSLMVTSIPPRPDLSKIRIVPETAPRAAA